MHSDPLCLLGAFECTWVPVWYQFYTSGAFAYGNEKMGRRSKQEIEQRFAGGKSIVLTTADINQVVCPNDKDQHVIWDTTVAGLGIRVARQGKKTYIIKKTFTINGQRKVIKEPLGSCLAISLEQARKQAAEMIQLALTTGLTTAELREREEYARMQERKAEEARLQIEQRKAEDRKKYTLAALCEAYANHLEAQGKVSYQSVRSSLTLHVIKAHPEIAALPANEVKRTDIAKILEKMIEKGVRAGVSRTRSYLVSAYNLAISVDGDVVARRFFSGFEIELNPAHQTGARSLRRMCGVGNRVLDEEEIRLFFREVCLLKPSPVRDVLIMNFYLGGQRTTQLLRARREDLDLRAGFITLLDPKGNRDRPRVHTLPLVGPALVYAKYLDHKAWLNRTDCLFASEVLPNQHVASDLVSRVAAEISNTLLANNLIRKKFTKADLRRTVETTLARYKVSMEVRGQLQSHGLSGVQIRHYDRHDYMDEKREALNIWMGVFMKEVCATPSKS